MAVVGTGTGITSTIEGPATPPETSDEAKFWNEVDKFKAKADEAYTLWQSLRAKRLAAQADAKLYAEYIDVMDKAEDITGKVSDVEKVVAKVRSGAADTIKSWFGLEGYEHARQRVRSHMGEMGYIWIVVSVVSAAAAWIASWISEAYVVDRKLQAVENLTAQGVPISEAGKLISDKSPEGALEIFAGKAGLGVALAGVAAVVLYFFFEKKRGF